MNWNTTVKTSIDMTEHALRLQKFRKHFVDTYIVDSHYEKEDFFADVVGKITSIDRTYGRVQEWKAKFPQVFKDVYCALALENLLAPYMQVDTATTAYVEKIGMI